MRTRSPPQSSSARPTRSSASAERLAVPASVIPTTTISVMGSAPREHRSVEIEKYRLDRQLAPNVANALLDNLFGHDAEEFLQIGFLYQLLNVASGVRAANRRLQLRARPGL